ncbi:ABC transporter [Lysinibacillus sp. 2017]|uniref:ABC transporter ATP-binding protein n=1 Tax=unclassified Lysinibacillus TaxID=2636778 RepID=UPI000D52638F|nr:MULTISPECIES: ATP-binding cassette domain-containing protein [unclassified Lysinibacillus]AWE07141.1 ABC transporter [Lysinibacillus sp. 2017]TGN36939.1 ABC transporter ATP-binding protein [Lysinibacillus sp. S2017]
MTYAIKVQDLKKQYGNVTAVKGISFSVKKGSFFAFLGSNGAGKSTTIEILCTLLEKTSGDVVINGHTLGTVNHNQSIRQSIGIVFQQSLLDPLLTVKENIIHRGRFYNMPKAQLKENYEFVYKYLQLEDIESKKYGQLSGGQRRRADIARAIIHKPNVLFLDEPTTGLDPHTRRFVWETIERLRQESNMTIFLTTHYMEEAANADQIVIIKRGEIVAQGTPNELKEQYASDQLIIALKSDVRVHEITALIDLDMALAGDVYKVKLPSTMDAIPIIQRISPFITSFEVVKGSIDQVFIQINEEK